MLFWTVVSFIAYSLTYFIVSQIKIRKMRGHIVELRRHRAHLVRKANLKPQFQGINS